jgi:uncharacterized protein YjbI with pentapeptide repeats
LRTTLLQALAGLFLATGLYFTAQTPRLNREGQITERFTRAIDQLGDEKLDVRLGGIYALERIARTSSPDQGPIMEILTAYIREHAPRPVPTKDNAEEAASSDDREFGESHGLSTDVQAVIAVLGRRELGRKEHRLDLSWVELRRVRFGKGTDEGHFEKAIFWRADLWRADLEGASLTGASLIGTNLTEANLRWADFTGANLTGANLLGRTSPGTDFTGADLTRAFLTGTNLTEAFLTGANLKWAGLTGANLAGANLAGANLTEALLTEADLTGANLTGANLTGADLTGANLKGAELTDALHDSATKWPAGFDPEAEGARVHTANGA